MCSTGPSIPGTTVPYKPMATRPVFGPPQLIRVRRLGPRPEPVQPKTSNTYYIFSALISVTYILIIGVIFMMMAFQNDIERLGTDIKNLKSAITAMQQLQNEPVFQNNIQRLDTELEDLKSAFSAMQRPLTILQMRRLRRDSGDYKSREMVEMLNPDNIAPDRRVNQRHKSIAAHYYGVSDYSSVDCEQIQWRESDWMSSIAETHGFVQTDEGVRVSHPGLYLIYAQLYYSHVRNLTGFSLKLNDSSLMTCAVSTHTIGKETKTNSCYVATMAYLKIGDILKVQNHHTANCITHPDKTYFGVVKMMDFKMKRP